MLKEAYLSVKEFEETVEPSAVPDVPTALTTEQKRNRMSYLVEELKEFEEAGEDLVDQADAILDLIYFALGTMVRMGIEPGELFNIVQEANMAKIQPDGTIHYREDGKVLKPEGWVSPEPKLQEAIEGQKFRAKMITISHKVKGNHFVTNHKRPHS